MDPHANPDLEVVGPGPCAERTLDVRGRLDGSPGAFEGCEELVGARIDLAAARFGHRRAEDAPHVVPHVAIPVAHAMEQGGGALDIGHQEGDKSGGERRRTDTVFLRSQLAGEEPDGYNAVLLRGIEQPLAGTLPGRLVLEGHLAKTGERVPHVRLVVNGQPPAAVGVDVGKGAIWQAGPFAGSEAGHASTIPKGRRRTQCRTARYSVPTARLAIGLRFSFTLCTGGSGFPVSSRVFSDDKIGAQPSRKSLADCSSGSWSWTSVSLTTPSWGSIVKLTREYDEWRAISASDIPQRRISSGSGRKV